MPLLYPERPTPYPVVDRAPNTSKALSNMNMTDLRNIFIGGTGGYLFGYFMASKPLRVPNGRYLCGIGLFAGLCHGVMSSSQRLMGLEPNDSEVRRFGVMTPEQIRIADLKESSNNHELIGTFSEKK